MASAAKVQDVDALGLAVLLESSVIEAAMCAEEFARLAPGVGSPRDRAFRLLFVFAKQYVLAVALAERCTEGLKRVKVEGACACLTRLRKRFPDVRTLRDSIAHADERMRGRARKRMLRGPISVGNVVGSRYECTGAHGRRVGLVVSLDEAKALRECVAGLLEAPPEAASGPLVVPRLE